MSFLRFSSVLGFGEFYFWLFLRIFFPHDCGKDFLPLAVVPWRHSSRYRLEIAYSVSLIFRYFSSTERMGGRKRRPLDHCMTQRPPCNCDLFFSPWRGTNSSNSPNNDCCDGYHSPSLSWTQLVDWLRPKHLSSLVMIKITSFKHHKFSDVSSVWCVQMCQSVVGCTFGFYACALAGSPTSRYRTILKLFLIL